MTYLNRFFRRSLSNALFLLLFCMVANNVQAQYFGQNKMRSKSLKFSVYETPHFNLHYYLENDTLVQWLAKDSEVWYRSEERRLGQECVSTCRSRCLLFH